MDVVGEELRLKRMFVRRIKLVVEYAYTSEATREYLLRHPILANMRLSVCILLAQSLYVFALPVQPGVGGIENYKPGEGIAVHPDHVVQRRENQHPIIVSGPGMGPEEGRPASGDSHHASPRDAFSGIKFMFPGNPAGRRSLQPGGEGPAPPPNPVEDKIHIDDTLDHHTAPRDVTMGSEIPINRRSLQPGTKESLPPGKSDGNVKHHDHPHERRSLLPDAQGSLPPVIVDGNDNNHIPNHPHKVHARDSDFPIFRREQLPGAEKPPSDRQPITTERRYIEGVEDSGAKEENIHPDARIERREPQAQEPLPTKNNIRPDAGVDHHTNPRNVDVQHPLHPDQSGPSHPSTDKHAVERRQLGPILCC